MSGLRAAYETKQHVFDPGWHSAYRANEYGDNIGNTR